MPFTIDVTTPQDTMLISVFPSNERTHRTSLTNIISGEHDIASAHHKLPQLDVSARDAITDWVNGSLIQNTDYGGWEFREGGIWVPRTYSVGDTATRDALTNIPDGFVYFNTDDETADVRLSGAWVPFHSISLATMYDFTESTSIRTITAADTYFKAPDGGGDLTASVTVPLTGRWQILTTAVIALGSSANGGQARSMSAALEEDEDAGTVIRELNTGTSHSHGDSDGATFRAFIQHRNTVPVSGKVYKYTPLGWTNTVANQDPTIGGGAGSYSGVQPNTPGDVNWIESIVLPL